MVDFAKYAFNKSHAAAYAAISMQTAYLKANYPLEFAVGLLTSVMDDSKKLMKYVRIISMAILAQNYIFQISQKIHRLVIIGSMSKNLTFINRILKFLRESGL